mgnify:CR=1 FL=1
MELTIPCSGYPEKPCRSNYFFLLVLSTKNIIKYLIYSIHELKRKSIGKFVQILERS